MNTNFCQITLDVMWPRGVPCGIDDSEEQILEHLLSSVIPA